MVTAVQEKQRRLASAGRRCAVYVRISLDREGSQLGVQRQEEDCRAYAERKGWTVVEVYVDNDVSASDGRPRPEYLRMLADAKAGKLDAIVVWHIDRLTRKVRELEDVIDLADQHGLALGTVTGDVDLSTPTGRMVARIVGSTARYEAEHKGERQRRQRRQAAEAGEPHKGGKRPYGYLPDRVTADPVEAPFIADAAKRVLAGETLRSVARDMNDRGATTVTGKPWSTPLLTQVLRSARISGRREVYPQGVSSSKGRGEIVATGCWDAIISPEDSDRLRALLLSPNRPNRGQDTRAKHLLTGLVRCGVCEARMTALAWERGGKYLYRCPSPGNAWGRNTCGRLSVLMKHAEPLVRDAVLEAIDTPAFWERVHARPEVDPATLEQVRRDEQQLENLAALMGEGELTMAEWKAAREPVQARLATNRALLARASNTNALTLLEGGGDLLERWGRLNPAQQRAVLGEVLEQVVVKPLPDGAPRNVFDPNRLVPIFRF